MRETEIYEQVRHCLPGEYTRIENAISSGVFDMYGACCGLGNWIECKVQSGNQIKVRGTQWIWATGQLAQGMDNLYFLVMKEVDDVPRLYEAGHIVRLCDPAHTDGGPHMLVSLKGIPTRARGWSNIRDVLYGG